MNCADQSKPKVNKYYQYLVIHRQASCSYMR